MTPKLTSEQLDAIRQSPGPVRVESEETREVFFLVAEATLDSLQREADRTSILKGISDLEAGRLLTLDQLNSRIHEQLRNG